MIANAMMLPGAAALATCGSHLFAFGVYLWIVAFLSFRCAFTLRARIARTLRTGDNPASPRGDSYRVVIFGNLLTLPAALATAALDPALTGFGVNVCIIALLSLPCAFIMRRNWRGWAARPGADHQEDKGGIGGIK